MCSILPRCLENPGNIDGLYQKAAFIGLNRVPCCNVVIQNPVHHGCSSKTFVYISENESEIILL